MGNHDSGKEEKLFEQCTPHNAVIDRMGHQALTLGSASVRYSIHHEHAFSDNSTVLHKHTPSRLTPRVPDSDRMAKGK